MKKIIEKYLLSIIICFLFIAAVPVAVSAQENTNTSTKNVFKELYMIRKNGPYGGELIWRCTPIDEENNIYVQNEVLIQGGLFGTMDFLARFLQIRHIYRRCGSGRMERK